jgi:hypothetical protein
MSIPNCGDFVGRLARDFPDDWRNAHTGNAHTGDFIRRLAWVLHSEVDNRFGLLGQRGNPNDIAEDAILYRGEGPGHDPTDGNRPVSAFDVIVGAGGSDPQSGWGFINQGGPAAWVQPSPVSRPVTPPPPVNPPVTPPPHPNPGSAMDLGPVLAKLDAALAELRALRGEVSELKGHAATAAAEAANAAGRTSDLKDTLAKGAEITGDIALSVNGGGLRGARATFDVTNQG